MEIKYLEQQTKCQVFIIPQDISGIYDKLTFLTGNQITYLKSRLSDDDPQTIVSINSYDEYYIFVRVDESKKGYWILENLRGIGYNLNGEINKSKFENISIVNYVGDGEQYSSLDLTLALAEGISLSNYQFLEFFTQDAKVKPLNKIFIIPNEQYKNGQERVRELEVIVEANFIARNLVNQPVSHLNAVALAKSFLKYGQKVGLSVEILGKDEIEEMGMGGLLAVNKGSIDPPTFSVITYKPEDAVNNKPIVLVGKGVVFDTGGLSLKPTASSMDLMKSDMAGSASVFGAIYAIAKNKTPIWVIVLVPSTDNRPGGDAYAPGDVVTMMSGLTVEVLNTDAEGRMILADALHYAKRFEPSLVINVATLTGAASQAIGREAIAVMSNADRQVINKLVNKGFDVFERMVEFPLWEDYGERIKSDIADIKNIGGRTAGMITAGKFLEKFTDYPFIHLDIAGSAFLESQDSYRGKNATGVGVRLLYHFLKDIK